MSFHNDATIFSTTTLSIMTLSKMDFAVTLSIYDTGHNNTWHKHLMSFCSVSLFICFNAMLDVIMLSVVMLNVIMLSVVMLNVIALHQLQMNRCKCYILMFVYKIFKNRAKLVHFKEK
jgi:hypothetical protein